MTTPLRRRIRHARRWCGYGVLVLLIGFALVVSVFTQFLPAVESHPDQIAAWLSERVGEKVSFSRAHGEWGRRGPRFVLDDLHIGEGANRLAIGRAQLQIAAYTGWLPGHPLTELKIRELSLTLVQDPQGRWQVVGLPGQGKKGDPLDRLEGFGELQIEKARLAIRSPQHKIDMRIPRVDARIRVNGPRLLVGVSAWVDAADPPVSAVLDFDRRSGDGLMWAGGNNLVLTHWNPLLLAVGIAPERGRGKLDLWTSVRDQRITQVTLKADINGARMRSSAPLRAQDGRLLMTRVDFDHLQADARWSKTTHGWLLQAPRLNVTRGKKVSHLDGLQVEGGASYSLRGRELDLSPLASMLALSDRLPGALRLFLAESNPQAVLRNVAISGRRNGHLRGSLEVSELSLQPQGRQPGLSGVAGKLRFDEHGGVLRLDSTPVRFDWPVALLAPEMVRLGGTLEMWRDGRGWTLGTGGLRLRGNDFGASLRVALGFQGDGSKPTLALSAQLDPATVATAKRFWIRHKMPPATVRWLDTALLDGEVEDGRIAIGGDLDDWPFANHDGNFDARAHIRDGNLKFNPAWPAGENMQLDLVFFGPGFSLTGSGDIHGNHVNSVVGGIEAFHVPMLKLAIDAEGPGEQLRQLMLASPLEKEYGEHMRALTIDGLAKVGVQMQFPLREGVGERHIDGNLDLAGAKLADSRWDIRFTDVTGRTAFSERGFATQDLSVRLADEPGTFNLRVGKDTGDANVAALATLDGRFSPATLLDHDTDLAWMKPWMHGIGNWKIAVGVPIAQGHVQPPSQLHVTSDLVGVELTMPAPLDKPAQQALALDVQAALPVDKGEITMRLGNLMRLRAQQKANAPIRGAIQFGDGAFAAAPAQGFTIRGRVARLDSTGWVAASSDNSGSGSSVHDVDLQADTLVFIDYPFADTHLQVDRAGALTHVVLKGKGIDGSVEVPDSEQRPVQGKFNSLFLPADSGVQPATTASAGTVEDPGALPAMRFSFSDLRIGAAQLGKAELQTSPMPSGMRIDKFQTQAKNLGMSAAGEWVRSTGGTRSSLRVDFTAGSLGQALDALGYKGMVEGGKTRATLTGNWPGSPGDLALATLSGSLKVDIGEGRMVNVDPGGSGRILGLLSLAEIPRRLTLDFSDFFQKGFAFNNVRGDFAFADGVAHTDNLHIDGPAAEIRVTGNTGMRDKVYDQRVEVLPKAGGVLPAIGFLAGGPAGAAVGAVAQAVLQRPLKQTTRVVYHVTGPWEKPDVKVIEKGPAKGQTASAPESTALEKP